MIYTIIDLHFYGESVLFQFTETYNAGHPLKAVKTLKQQLKKEKIPKKEFNKLWKTVKKLRESDESVTIFFVVKYILPLFCFKFFF